ncbi:hypothetical protein [Aeromicrobium sp. Leaf350]|uniref:hypothetical protein n=1 Tax=Aeromicrobium sp. Leaf350 TaxID=2876565 RepID=UPI001E420AC9|nr:hypothetical protein [Aeromicrobium sp. Leaf350]
MSVTGARLRHGRGRGGPARRSAVAATIVLVLVVAQACTGGGGEDTTTEADQVTTQQPGDAMTLVDDAAPTDRALAVSELLFTRSEVVVVATADQAAPAAELAREHGVPVLPAEAAGLPEELTRLDTATVLLVGEPVTPLPDLVGEVVPVEATALEASLSEHLTEPQPVEAAEGAVVLTLDPAADVLSLATAGAGDVVAVPGGDPRTDPAVADQLRELGDRPTIVLGTGWVEPQYTLDVVRNQPEQPGGGHTIFPGRHVVALYGSPGIPALGMLGEQDPAASVVRTQQVVDQYAAISDRPVVGAFELISTIADADIGPDGDYSREVPVETLRPWVDAARDAGLYVILDLQPGRTDFLTQAKRYEELLREPHVGLALDPEWRLAPDQVHLRQFGSVTGAEADAVAAWLAELTREEDLPQKLFVLHQFATSMITDRQLVRSDRPELQVVIHVDGQGSPGAKVGTWNVIRQGAAPSIAWGWKNFVHEDLPMLTPEQTWGVAPRPDLVTYQ